MVASGRWSLVPTPHTSHSNSFLDSLSLHRRAMASTISATKLFVGRLPRDARVEDVEDHFRPIGKLVNVDVRVGFAFVEYEDERDCKEAISTLDGSSFLGNTIVVEAAKARNYNASGGAGQKGVRIVVMNLDLRVSWQDLKDFTREHCPGVNILFANVYSDGVDKNGVIELDVSILWILLLCLITCTLCLILSITDVGGL